MAQALPGDDVMPADGDFHGQPDPPSNEEKKEECLSNAEKFQVFAANVKTKTAQVSKSMSKKASQASKKAIEKSKDRLSLQGQLQQARISLEQFVNPKILSEDTQIPKWVLKKAHGIVFLTIVKLGFLFAGSAGTGIVIVRKPDGKWSGPSSVGVAGVSFGLLAGASKVDYIMILPNAQAVKQFTGVGQVRLGVDVQVAAGPIGREASGSVGAGDKGVSMIFSYSHAQGLYGGISLDGNIISVRPDCNNKFYKRKVSCADILTGKLETVPENEDYERIVHLLDSYCNGESGRTFGESLSLDDITRDTQGEEFVVEGT